MVKDVGDGQVDEVDCVDESDAVQEEDQVMN